MHGKPASAPHQVRSLRDLREQRGVTQQSLADRLGVKQPTVSKVEQRPEIFLGTLRDYVEALGGVLLVTASFNDISVELVLGEADPPSSR